MINDYFTIFTQSIGLHPVAALIIGILVAVNPCQIAICLSAIFAKKNENTNLSSKLLLFASGRAAMYILVGFVTTILYSCFKIGTSTYADKITFYIDLSIPFLSILVGLFLLSRVIIKHHHDDNCHNSRNIIRKNRPFGMFFLGAILTLLFCPESAFLFFGALIPLAVNSELGFINILVFAFAAVLPLIIIALICYKAENKMKSVELKLEKFQNIMNLIVAFILIALGVFMIIEKYS